MIAKLNRAAQILDRGVKFQNPKLAESQARDQCQKAEVEEVGGGAQVKAEPWFAGVSWAKLIACEMPSPLLDVVKEHQTSLLTEKPPDDLPEGPLKGDETDDERWLTGFT